MVVVVLVVVAIVLACCSRHWIWPSRQNIDIHVDIEVEVFSRH